MGKSSGCILAEYDFTVGHHVEYAVRSGDEFCGGINGIFNFVRHTGGLRLIVSHRAVVDSDLHTVDSLWKMAKDAL
jgi:hypothetical protein